MQKEIGIISFHKSLNYGSVLLSWSLQNELTKLGYKNRIIDYEPERYHDLYCTLKPWKSFANIKWNIARLIKDRQLMKKSFSFYFFRKRKLRLTKKCDSKNFQSIAKKFLIMISGGDQIWNLNAWDCDKAHFLCTKHNCKKIAYSVSINNLEITNPRFKEFFGTYANKYDYISVREKTGKDKLDRYYENKICINSDLDPVLLKRKEDFLKITSKRIIKNDYIFLYTLQGSDDIYKAAKILSQKTKLPIMSIYISPWIESKAKNYGVNIDYRNLSPCDFLSYVKNASFVVTNSFHGVAFSLLFEKEFLAINNVINCKKQNDERLLGVVKLFDIENRYLTVDEFHENTELQALDYSRITKKRLILAKQSIKNLLEAIRK